MGNEKYGNTTVGISELFPANITDTNQSPYSPNPLLQINGILKYVQDYRTRVKAFYFDVLLSQYRCPKCGGSLHMADQSECSCVCGHRFDPTLAFQVSPCCMKTLTRKTFHYACSGCHKIVPSRFIFDERLFDAEYFREMMQDSRRRAMAKKEEVRKLLAESRSGVLTLKDDPDFDAIPELFKDLDLFIQNNAYQLSDGAFDLKSGFDMTRYRTQILSLLSQSPVCFSSISPIPGDNRLDKVRR
ncbi:MAG: hypothetical protein WCJ37_18395, partial [Syntrophus sp. (in: bacteria)]